MSVQTGVESRKLRVACSCTHAEAEDVPCAELNGGKSVVVALLPLRCSADDSSSCEPSKDPRNSIAIGGALRLIFDLSGVAEHV